MYVNTSYRNNYLNVTVILLITTLVHIYLSHGMRITKCYLSYLIRTHTIQVNKCTNVDISNMVALMPLIRLHDVPMCLDYEGKCEVWPSEVARNLLWPSDASKVEGPCLECCWFRSSLSSSLLAVGRGNDSLHFYFTSVLHTVCCPAMAFRELMSICLCFRFLLIVSL